MSKSMLSVVTDIRNLFLNNATIMGLVGTNIFPLVAPEGTTGDFITVKRAGYKTERTKFGVLDETATMIIAAFSTDYDRSLEIAEAMRTVILNIRVDKVALEIKDAPEDMVSAAETGQAWFVQPFYVEACNLHKH